MRNQEYEYTHRRSVRSICWNLCTDFINGDKFWAFSAILDKENSKIFRGSMLPHPPRKYSHRGSSCLRHSLSQNGDLISKCWQKWRGVGNVLFVLFYPLHLVCSFFIKNQMFSPSSFVMFLLHFLIDSNFNCSQTQALFIKVLFFYLFIKNLFINIFKNTSIIIYRLG